MPNVPKAVLIVAPHTSGWDVVYAVAAMLALGIRARWMAKHTLFRPPLGAVLRYLGGLAIERSSHHGVVQQAIAAFNREPKLVLGIAPEGTRSRVHEWKTGFYHIARGARVPIVCVFLDYEQRRLGFGPSLEPSGDIHADMDVLRRFYSRKVGHHPELFDPEWAFGDEGY